MSKWLLQTKKADFNGLSAMLNVDPVLVRIMVNRGLTTAAEMDEYLHPSFSCFKDPFLLKDVEKACDILLDAIDEGIKIRVIGDYDVDGIMSTYILTEAIKEAGGDVDYAVPHRIEDGYGVNPQMVEAAYEAGVGLIITCDNGIAAFEAVSRAKELGMGFIITDHHEIPYDEVDRRKVYKMPMADAIVDPKRQDCQYPFKSICGAQVAWKLSYVLFDMIGIDRVIADSYLQFAAIACVCDVMELKGENRSLVYFGLKAIENTSNVGLRALLARNDLTGKTLSAYHLGFVIGPCLNASGRLDTATRAVELLSTENEAVALALAGEMVELNTSRKTMTQAGIDAAKEAIESNHMENDRVLVIYLPSLHESLAGIVAGRIKETYFKPTLVITDSEDMAKGSGRSIEAYNMFEELSKVKDIFTKFGGHPMAAGISLEKNRVDELRARLNENCCLTADQMVEIVRIDAPMPLSYITESLIEQIDTLSPFGTGNSKPLFALKNVKVGGLSYMGKENQFLRMTVYTENGRPMKAVLFRDVDGFEERICSKYSSAKFESLFSRGAEPVEMDIVYEPYINEFRGERSIQITIEKFQ